MDATVTVAWWRTYSSGQTESLISRHTTCKVPLKEGRHPCPIVESDTVGKPISLNYYMEVEVKRWSRGWMLTPIHPEIQDSDSEVYTPEQRGHTWLVRDDQPSQVWTWLDFDSGFGYLGRKFQLTIVDGRLVDTPCGNLINPYFRRGIDDPEEWTGPLM